MAPTCQVKDCDRHASGKHTRRMFSESQGESYPEDVSERPVCAFHHWGLLAAKVGITTVMFALFFGLMWYIQGVIAP